jgi:hypothetical protein
MVKFSNEIKALDFSVEDIDKLIDALQEAKRLLETYDHIDIAYVDDGIILQASDRDHIWIEPVSNITD